MACRWRSSASESHQSGPRRNQPLVEGHGERPIRVRHRPGSARPSHARGSARTRFKPPKANECAPDNRLLGQGGHETSGKSVKNPPPQGRIARRIGFDLTVGAGWWERPTCRPLLQTPQNRPLPGQGRVETRLSREEVGQSERNGGRGRFACGAPPSPGALLLPGRPHHTCYESSSGKNLWSASPSPGCDSGCNSSAAT
jgi:hypothetical protein